ncbi:hypothetical protein HF086_005934 [Spodoptera exigua]|uniref:Vacuolar protein sorting-associated protein 53 homolog n=1 Tax=Spodoptera exigua TaxID=7107 RepID=A0A922MUV1_SPOEX|nr:hypothetical protein HF086_005934 [Spodoptera exigua]
MDSNDILDDKDSGPEVQINFPSSVMTRIEEMMGGTEQFDSAEKAERSESMVREITSEIKQLDCAKSNLTAAITALNHLHMLVGGVDTLRAMTTSRQYKEIVLPMQAIMEEYEHLFSCEQEYAWVSHVERRYAWLKRHLLAFEESLAALFPHSWRLSERIAQQFCQMTCTALGGLLASRRSELDVKLLLYAIQKTYNFELLLHKRFTDLGAEPLDVAENKPDTQPEPGADGTPSPQGGAGGTVGPTGSAWIGLIGSCFEPYLSLYVSSLDANLSELMERFIQDAKASASSDSSSGVSAVGEGGAGGAVISSCADLFLFYKKCLVQCARLTTGEPMLELAGVFQKYLRLYASGVLQASLPRAGGLAPALAAPSLVANLQTLLRDDDGRQARYSDAELSRITSVISTAEYCLETTVHLEHKLREKVAPALAHRLDLAPEQELFHKLIDSCIQLLVAELEAACEPALGGVARAASLGGAGGAGGGGAVRDQSAYVGALASLLRGAVPRLRDRLASSRKYFTQFCIRFANSFIPKFIQTLYKCKPASAEATEQLLLDTHMLKTVLLDLPGLGSEVRRPAPATYTKVVIKLMTKAEMILKLVLAPLDGPLEGFAAHCVQLLPDLTLAEFHKVLDMKALRLSKAQQASLDAAFKRAAKQAAGDANK